jgi:hypothetical protein
VRTSECQTEGGTTGTVAATEGRIAGERFVHALAAKDGDALRGLFADRIDFQGLTPGRHWQTDDPRELVEDILLGAWFEPTDAVEQLLAVGVGAVADRQHLSYRFAVRNLDGEFVVEQQAYFLMEGSTISWLRILCSGYRVRPAARTSG